MLYWHIMPENFICTTCISLEGVFNYINHLWLNQTVLIKAQWLTQAEARHETIVFFYKAVYHLNPYSATRAHKSLLYIKELAHWSAHWSVHGISHSSNKMPLEMLLGTVYSWKPFIWQNEDNYAIFQISKYLMPVNIYCLGGWMIGTESRTNICLYGTGK